MLSGFAPCNVTLLVTITDNLNESGMASGTQHSALSTHPSVAPLLLFAEEPTNPISRTDIED